jgi:hypothetical protein
MGRPRKRRREDVDLEGVDLNHLEQFTNTGFGLSSPDLLYDFNYDILSTSPFINPPDMNFGALFDPGLVHIDPSVTQYSDQVLNHEETGASSRNSNGQETRNAVLLQSEDHGPSNRNELPFQVSTLASFPTSSKSSSDTPLPSGGCTCLSDMYLTLSNLQSLDQFSFPETLLPIRTSLHTTKSLLECSLCPKKATSAMQNVMHLATLLTTITDSYRKLLEAIDTEATRASEAGERKKFRMGDSSPEKAHLHTGTSDCPMGFFVNLDGQEWKVLARKVVEGDIAVTSRDSSHQITVLGLANMLEERQLRWHQDRDMNQMHDHFAGDGLVCTPNGGEFHCLKMVAMVRNHVALLNL